MVGEQSSTTGGGAVTPPVPVTPSVTPGAGGTPGGTGAGGTATPVQPRVVPEEILPEALRGKSPQEQKFVLQQMVSTLGELRSRVKELERGPAPAPKEEPKPDQRPPEERILEEPEKVIAEVVERLYGPVVTTLQSGVEEITESVSASDISDWADVKDEVFDILKEAGAPKTKANIAQAYEVVVGRHTLAQRRQTAAAALNPDIPVDKPTNPPAKELVGLEKEIFEASKMSREEWDRYGNPDNFEIKVPTGKKKESNA